MASSIIGDDFTGSGELVGAQVDTGSLAGAWQTTIGTWSGGTPTTGTYAYQRSSTGGRLTAQYTGDMVAAQLITTTTTFTRGPGVLTIEVSAYGAFKFGIFFGTGAAAYLEVSGANGPGGADFASWGGPSGHTGVFASADSLHDITQKTVLRIELDATGVRFYEGGALKATDITAAVTTSIVVNAIAVGYYNDLVPTNVSTLLLDYISLKTETVTGPLGKLSGARAEPIIPRLLIQENFVGSGQIHGTAKQGYGYWRGAWGAQDISPVVGFTVGNMDRTNGGLRITPSADAVVVNLNYQTTDGTSRIGGGHTYVRVVFFANPTITITTSDIVTGSTNYLIQMIPSSDGGFVGTSPSSSPATPFTLSVSAVKRTVVVFQLSLTGLKIYADGSGTPIYSDGVAYSADTQITGVGLSWNVAPLGSQVFPGGPTAHILEWVEVEQGASAVALFGSIPGALPSIINPSTIPDARVVAPKIFGKYTFGGKTKIIVPPNVPLRSPPSRGAAPYSVTATASVTSTSGANSMATPQAAGAINITTPVLLTDPMFGPTPSWAQTLVPGDPEHLEQTGYPAYPSPYQNGPLTVGDWNITGITTVAQARKRNGVPWTETITTALTFTRYKHDPQYDHFNEFGLWVTSDAVMPDATITAAVPTKTVPAAQDIAYVAVPGFNFLASRPDLTMDDLVLPEDLTVADVTVVISFSGAGPRPTLSGGPADGTPFDSVVVVNDIPEASIKRLGITIYEDYAGRTKKDPTKTDAPPAYSRFWTKFQASYEVPAEIPPST